jgi:putative DNA methylase
MTHSIKSPKKLIEVALPLDDINEAAAREKSIRHGHPSTLHLWWARRPLAAARAVIFAQMVNDPGYQRELGFGVNKKEAEIKREKLFQIIRDLVKWENTNNEDVLQRARDAIWESWRETCQLNRNHPQAAEIFNPEKLPAFHDPFAGGGALPLEAQRLGLESYASDLNPVAVMINKAMIEIPPKFSGCAPIGPIPDADKFDKKSATKDMHCDWSGSKGLAEDVRRYGSWIREEAFKRIGHLYPKVKITDEMIAEREDLAEYKGEELTVIACLWARTIKSPNPMFSHVDVPLVSSYILSSKAGKEAWIEPIVNGEVYEFKVRIGKPPKEAAAGTKAGRGGNFNCLVSNTPIPVQTIRDQGRAGTLGQKLIAVVAEGSRGRVYLSPTYDMEMITNLAKPEWQPETLINHNPRDIRTQLYGLDKYGDLFTPRQLVALTTFSDLVQEARLKVIADAKSSGMKDDNKGIESGGLGATAYADAVAVYLGMAVSRTANTINAHAVWSQSREQTANLFSRQAIGMSWDFPEVNPFAGAAGDFGLTTTSMKKNIENYVTLFEGHVVQQDAMTQRISANKVVSTDPPYYDNVAYADLSDFFYVWMRPTLRNIYPTLFSTMAVPKAEELVAAPYRHGGKEKSEVFFLEGMKKAIRNIAEQAHPVFPVTIYYAFKQSETKDDTTSSTGWETFLEAVVKAGFSIDGTWPMRTERPTGVKTGSNVLASSVILVCRKRPLVTDLITRREFQKELRNEMPEALETMIGGETGKTPIAPVDLAQAAIGPGMAIYSKYGAILNQDGSSLSVHDALVLINQAITDYLNPDSGRSDSDTLFCSAWFEQYGWGTGNFGEADTLARAKGTSVEGVRDAGVVESSTGKVRLLKWSEYPTDYDPRTDKRNPIWEACHQIIRVLQTQGENSAGQLLARMPEHGEPIRQLAYHLYTLCERKKWAEEARAYNELIGSWSAISAASYEVGHVQEQVGFDF